MFPNSLNLDLISHFDINWRLCFLFWFDGNSFLADSVFEKLLLDLVDPLHVAIVDFLSSLEPLSHILKDHFTSHFSVTFKWSI